MRTSSPSILMSVPEYLPNRILSPTFTSRATLVPFSRTLPLPAASTSPSCGFSLAVSGMMMPPFAVSFSSRRRTTRRSCSGRTFMAFFSFNECLPGGGAEGGDRHGVCRLLAFDTVDDSRHGSGRGRRQDDLRGGDEQHGQDTQRYEAGPSRTTRDHDDGPQDQE